ncbi:MAG: hypothetical protein V1736_12630 [Pseudomonadota bacterium]
MRRHGKLVLLLVCLLSLLIGIPISYGAKMPRLGWKGPRVVGLERPREYREGELLVKFKRGIRPRAASAYHAGIASEVKRRFARTGIEHIKLKAGLSMKEAIERYRKDSNVEYVEPNFDEFVKSRKVLLFVIPAEAGIQSIQVVTGELDPGFHRSDDFLRDHQL